MSSYSFDYNFIKAGAPIVTISSLGLAFNYISRSLLKFPDRINIGYDENANTIGIKLHDDNSKLPYYEFETREKNGWIRIGCKDFIRFLDIKTQLDFINKSQQFIAEYDDELQMLLIVIDSEHMKKTEEQKKNN